MQKVVALKKICNAKNPSLSEKRKSRSEELNSFSKRSAKQKSAKKTKQKRETGKQGNNSFSGRGVPKSNAT